VAAIVAPGICRYAAKGTIFGRQWVNVWDLHVRGAVGDRGDAIRECAEVLYDAYFAIKGSFGGDWKFDSVSYVDLDEADGRTGSVDRGNTATGPFIGGGVAAASPNVAVLVKKATGGRRGARSGRVYLAGPTEGGVTGNVLDTSYRTTLQTGMTAFLASLTNGSWLPDVTSAAYRPVVVHTQGGVFTSSEPISSLTVQSVLATQRRRLRP
jgi:hypothetical protein